MKSGGGALTEMQLIPAVRINLGIGIYSSQTLRLRLERLRGEVGDTTFAT